MFYCQFENDCQQYRYINTADILIRNMVSDVSEQANKALITSNYIIQLTVKEFNTLVCSWKDNIHYKKNQDVL